MPELPEVETVRTGLNASLSGAQIDRVRLLRANLRIPFPLDLQAKIEGRTVEAIHRRAKYLLWQLDSDNLLLAHLGMSGAFIVRKKPEKLEKHDHVEMVLTDGRQLIYRDPRRFGLITLAHKKRIEEHKLIRHLGPEPLEKGFNAAYLKEALSRRNVAVKAALMDQKLVVGVGNIYASEALFLAGVHPLKPAKEAANKAPVLVKAIRKVLGDAIASGGSSLRDFVDISGETGYFQHDFQVYGRKNKPCMLCGVGLESVSIGGRSSFFCPSCQS